MKTRTKRSRKAAEKARCKKRVKRWRKKGKQGKAPKCLKPARKRVKKPRKPPKKLPAKKPPAPPKPAAKAPTKPPAPAAPARPPAPPPEPTPPPAPAPSVYGGTFGVREATRLLWRAGFGPRPGEAEQVAAAGLDSAVHALTRPSGEATLTGPEPKDQSGNPLAPNDASGHDHLWWLDRMVRSDQQLVERMALVWHDWFATSNAGVASQKLMLEQNELFRRNAFVPFRELLEAVTANPATLVWLTGNQNRKGRMNENYARELMELFTLGADRGAYTETDIREMARALTGFRNDQSAELGRHNFRFDPAYHDGEPKTIFGRRGNFDWRGACGLCTGHRMHPSFFVTKLWSYFVPVPPDAETQASLEYLYWKEGLAVRPVVEAILKHPALYEGPAMVKPPVVLAAGMLRALGRGIESTNWTSYCEQAGQRLFRPPNVAGWEDHAWLDTSTVRGRWLMIGQALQGRWATATGYDATETPEAALEKALGYWGEPSLTGESRECLGRFASTCLPMAMTSSQKASYRALRQNALRQLIAASPDYQVS